jgi:hypothetical protein
MSRRGGPHFLDSISMVISSKSIVFKKYQAAFADRAESLLTLSCAKNLLIQDSLIAAIDYKPA